MYASFLCPCSQPIKRFQALLAIKFVISRKVNYFFFRKSLTCPTNTGITSPDITRKNYNVCICLGY